MSLLEWFCNAEGFAASGGEETQIGTNLRKKPQK